DPSGLVTGRPKAGGWVEEAARVRERGARGPAGGRVRAGAPGEAGALALAGGGGPGRRGRPAEYRPPIDRIERGMTPRRPAHRPERGRPQTVRARTRRPGPSGQTGHPRPRRTTSSVGSRPRVGPAAGVPAAVCAPRTTPRLPAAPGEGG